MLLAAVDLGSNSFRLEIGRAQDADRGAHIERVGYWKETVRLAAGLDEHGRLSKRAIESACETLARMNERLRGVPSEHVRAVGTQALRSALNVDEFLLEAQHALGHPIEVIAGREEARLVFEGCMHTLPPSPARRLVVDIGGGSTELIVGEGFTAQRAESFKVGCVTTSLRFFRDGVIDRTRFKRAQVAVSAEIEEAVEQFSRAHWAEAYGSSGTVDAISSRPARGALRVGVLYDLLGRRESRDIRDATVERLQGRFGVDTAQAARVARLAVQAAALLAPAASEAAVKRLAWAAALHEVGFAISHNDHHKHGAYLVQHSDLPGFSTNDQERIAALVLAQRGNLKKVAAVLEDPERRAKVMALRLAVIFCHARRDLALPAWSLQAQRGGAELALDRDWLDRHPLTEHLLEEEAGQWDKVGLKLALRSG